MRTANAAAITLSLLGALAPVAASAEMVAPWMTCELRYVNRAKAGAARCLSCHDGSAGPAISTGHGTSHPVGVSYALAASARGGFRPVEEIAQRNLVLADGQVTCTTCHDWRSGLGAHTAARELCTGCHVR